MTKPVAFDFSGSLSDSASRRLSFGSSLNLTPSGQVQTGFPAGLSGSLSDSASRRLSGSLSDSASRRLSSPAVRQLPELLEVHQLAEYVHGQLIALGEDLPLALSGWVQQEASGYLAEARAALWHCAAVVAKGAQHHANDREVGV